MITRNGSPMRPYTHWSSVGAVPGPGAPMFSKAEMSLLWDALDAFMAGPCNDADFMEADIMQARLVGALA